jgi:hypothetical protein
VSIEQHNGAPRFLDGQPDQFESLDAEQLSNGMYVWVFTSPGGACHQGAKQYKRRTDAVRAGREWLAKLRLGAQ